MPILPNELLNQRYRIIHLLAEGAYGAVYRVYDIKDKRHYALKEYRDTSPDTRQLFRAEAQRLTRLKHPQLPAIIDHFFLPDKGQYLITEYIDGIDLQSLLDQYGPLPSDLIIQWLQAIAKPLTYLHEQGTVHLNLKPANIRLTPQGDLYLVDTGLPGLGVPVGNSGYAAPEQAKQEEATPASDIYGLGATLYTLLTSHTPADALRRQSGLDLLPTAREANPNIEPYLSVVASRAMDLNPEVRFESVADFAHALERPHGRAHLEYEKIRETSPKFANTPPPPRLPSPMRRELQRRTALALAGLFAIIVVVGLIALQLSDRIQITTADPIAATATTQSQLIAALTQLAPTITPTPEPTATPEPTPAPYEDRLTGARMLYVPEGVFRYGNDDGEEDEQPSSVVRLDAFYIDEVEVTNGQYAQCVDAGICAPPLNTEATFHPTYYGDPDYTEYPVIFVNWFMADTYCQWRDARLPSEAEWEKAAGFDIDAFVKYTYPWGDEFNGENLNFCDSNCPTENRNATFNDGNRDTARVGSYATGQSPTGVYDMSGNVMEWVADWYNEDYYQEISRVNPLGPLDGTGKSLRGGSWLSTLEQVTVTDRSSRVPSVARANIGFRCARNVD